MESTDDVEFIPVEEEGSDDVPVQDSLPKDLEEIANLSKQLGRLSMKLQELSIEKDDYK